MNWEDPFAELPKPVPAAKPIIVDSMAATRGALVSATGAPLSASDASAYGAAAPAQQAAAPQPLLDIKPVNPEDKRVVNGMTDVNQLAPFKYPWAWDYFLKANKNHWTPLDINMAQDVHDYQHKLTLEERHVYENVLSYLTTSDVLAMRNIGLAVMEKMSAPELQIYQARQVYEEALHTWTYQHCIETLNLDQG